MTDTRSDQPLIVEDLMLLLLDDETGGITTAGTMHLAFSGALLAELAIDGHITVPEDRRWWQGTTVHAVEGSTPTDPLLRDAYDEIATKPRDAQTLLHMLGHSLHDALIDRLVDRGLIRRERHRVLGIIPTTRLPIADGTHEAALVARVRSVLVDGEPPEDAHTAAVVALVSASGAVPSLHRQIPWSGAVSTRGKEIEQGSWGASAVSSAVMAATAAIAASSAAVAIAVSTVPGRSTS